MQQLAGKTIERERGIGSERDGASLILKRLFIFGVPANNVLKAHTHTQP